MNNQANESILILEDRHILWSLEMLYKITGLGRTAIYAAIKDDNFPMPLKIGARRSMWRKSDVLKWIDSRPQELELKPQFEKKEKTA